MKIKSAQVLKTIEAVHSDAGKVVEIKVVESNKVLAELTDDHQVENGAQVDLNVIVKCAFTGEKLTYTGTAIGISPRAVYIPTGSCKGTGKPRQMGSVARCREIISGVLDAGGTRQDAIASCIDQGLNKYTATTQYAVVARQKKEA